MCKWLMQYYTHFLIYPLADQDTELSPAYYKFAFLSYGQ